MCSRRTVMQQPHGSLRAFLLFLALSAGCSSFAPEAPEQNEDGIRRRPRPVAPDAGAGDAGAGDAGAGDASAEEASVGDGSAAGRTVQAASCNGADVQAALDRAVDGDTVLVPAGICHWSSTVSVAAKGSLTIRGAGSPSTLGGGDAT